MSRNLTESAAAIVAAFASPGGAERKAPKPRKSVRTVAHLRPLATGSLASRRAILRIATRVTHILVLLSLLTTSLIPATSASAAPAVGGLPSASASAAPAVGGLPSAVGDAAYHPPRFQRSQPRLGDRLVQTIDGAPEQYTLDLNTGLTQVLADGENTYLYGAGRVGEEQPAGWQYHLGDALGSVRHLADASAAVASARAYDPFGATLLSAGPAATNYAFTGEWLDTTGLIHLRARYLDPSQGRFFQPDPWQGDTHRPQTLNNYGYVGNNPITFTDPSGRCYGALSFLRDLEPVGCNNMDLTNIIIANPNASLIQKSAAWSYQLSFTAAHAYLAAGLYLFSPAWAASGMAIGGGYAGVRHALARSGACGCEAQLAAQRAGLWQDVGRGAALGLATGGPLGAVYAAGAGGQIAVGSIGAGLSGYGLYASGSEILTQGPNLCNVMDASASAAGLVASGLAIRSGVRTWRTSGRLFGSQPRSPSAVPPGGGPARRVEFPRIGQVQHAYDRHGPDFGFTQNWNTRNGRLFTQAIANHVQDPGVTQVAGNYRAQPAIFYVNQRSNLLVFTRPNGDFWSGWLASPSQVRSILTSGRLY